MFQTALDLKQQSVFVCSNSVLGLLFLSYCSSRSSTKQELFRGFLSFLPTPTHPPFFLFCYFVVVVVVVVVGCV